MGYNSFMWISWLQTSLNALVIIPTTLPKLVTSIPFLRCENSSQQTVANEGLCIWIPLQKISNDPSTPRKMDIRMYIYIIYIYTLNPKKVEVWFRCFSFSSQKTVSFRLQPLKFQGCSCFRRAREGSPSIHTVPKLKLGRRSFPIGKVTFQALLLLNFQGG